jgi:hypothetical protein
MVHAWHFVGDRLRDGRPVPQDGVWLVHEGNIHMCNSGLHASRDPWDALHYAPGAMLCRVHCDDVAAEDNDMLVCRRRRIVARADATDALQYFARMQALSVVHLWDAPDVVLDYLMTGDLNIRAAASDAAWDAARAAAWDAARDAARAAAWDAARAAAWDAAWDAARDAARAAAWAAARAAAWDAARAAARNDFHALVAEAFELSLAAVVQKGHLLC